LTIAASRAEGWSVMPRPYRFRSQPGVTSTRPAQASGSRSTRR
jgi:hypothetical protein